MSVDTGNPNPFLEISDSFAEGKEMGSPRFNEFLRLGIEHWIGLAEADGFFKPTYEHLVKKYKKAFEGGYDEKVEFCADEAGYLVKMAEELRGMHDEEGALRLEDRAKNWNTVPMSFTMF